jgi:hypothetical protein
MTTGENRRIKEDRDADDPFFGYLFAETPKSAEAVGWKPKENVFFLTTESPSTGANVLEVINVPAYSVNPIVYYPQLSGFGGTGLEVLTTINDTGAATTADLRRIVAGFSRLQPNWDDEGAVAISAETVERALQVIEHIAVVLERKRTTSSPSVLAFPDGSIFFKWIHGLKELNITVEGRNITAQRWQPLDAYHALGMWPISMDDTSEQVEWVLS